MSSAPCLSSTIRYDGIGQIDLTLIWVAPRQPVWVAEAARTAVIAVPAADAVCTSRLKETGSHSWRLTVRRRRNVIAGDLIVRTQIGLIAGLAQNANAFSERTIARFRWPLEKPPIGPGSQ